MALGWFQGSKEMSLPELIAAKKYHKAIEILKARFGEGSRDPWMRMQLADVLVLAGRPREAVPILNALADEFAREGFAAKAIAVLKKLQKIEPARKDVDKRLAELIQQKHTTTSSRSEAPTEAVGGEIGIEDLGIMASSVSVSVAVEPSPVARPPAAPAPSATRSAALDLPDAAPVASEEFDLSPVAAAPTAAPAPPASPLSEAEFEEEFIAALQDFIEAGEKRGPLPTSEEEELRAAFFGTSRSPVTSTLFDGFTEDELCAVIGGLELITFQPGDIVITEGEPGDSLFVLTTGLLKTFVRDAKGHNTMVRVMDEGSFFGEISVLTGSPRSATVVSATRSELLELDRASLESIVANHPRVRNVIEESRKARSGSEEETLARERAGR
jgi:hypothetical protein